MNKLKIELNRYDGRPLTAQIRADSLKFKGNEAWLVCELGEDDEFEIYFEAVNGTVESSTLEVAKSLMRSIDDLDNKVQESCAAECKRSGLHPQNFEGMLAYVRVYPNRAILHYFGTGVNTEWDETACFDGVEWKYLGIAKSNGGA
jgi:hypothetical protein